MLPVFQIQHEALKTGNWESLRKFYLPKKIKFILIGSAAPEGNERFFYYDNVPQYDNLFINVMKVLFPKSTSVYQRHKTTEGKRELLESFRAIGGYVMDVYPLVPESNNIIDSFVKKLKEIEPFLPKTKEEFKRIWFIAVHKDAYGIVNFLKSKGFLTALLPFPLYGKQEFFINNLSEIIDQLSS